MRSFFARATGHLADVDFVQADSGHGFHWQRPAQYVQLVLALARRVPS